MSEDAYRLQRVLAVQDALMDALTERDPEAGLVARVASSLSCSAVLLDPAGALRASGGPAADERLWRGLDLTGHRRRTATVGCREVTALPILADDRLQGWLVVAIDGRYRPPAKALVSAVVATAQRLLALTALTRRAAGRQTQRMREELLSDALDLGRHEDGKQLLAGILAAGIGLGPACRVLALRPRTPAGTRCVEEDADAFRQATDSVLEADRIPSISLRRGEATIVLAELEAGAPERIVDALERAGLEAHAGVGRAVEQLGDAANSLHDAQLALQQLRRMAGTRRVLGYEDLDITMMTISACSLERVAPKIVEMLGPAKAHPHIFEAIVAYFAEDLDVNRAAARLFLQPNSLRYRLARAEEILGRPLREPATIADLHLALTIDSELAAVQLDAA